MRFNYSWIPFIVFIPIIILFGIYYLNQAYKKEGFKSKKTKKTKKSRKKKGVCVPKTTIFNKLKKLGKLKPKLPRK
jgi:hypothetical protein